MSSAGLGEAEIVADLLGTEPVAAVYSSPRERAWYTAREIADRFGVKVSIAEGLDEVDFGEWAGKTFAELEDDSAWTQWNERRGSARARGGESMAEAVDRAIAAVEQIAREHAEQTVVAVSHCDVIRGIIAHVLGLPLDNLLRFDVDPASVSRLRFGSWGSRVTSINERLYQ